MKRQKWLIKSLSALMACILITGMLAIPVSAEGTNDTFGSVSYFSTASPGDELSDSYYYTDDWFFENNSARNDALALVSMQLVAASVDEDGYGTGFLTDLGFEDVKYVRAGTSGNDMCHYITGRKSIQKDGSSKTVTAVVMESYSFDTTVKQNGWTQNFVINNGEEVTPYHFGLHTAAESAVDEILNDLASDSVLWITGQSRGGSLAELTAHELVTQGAVDKEQVFCYAFEAPAVMNAHDGDCCDGVHNYISHDDLVTMVPPWGMVRCGHEYELSTEETNTGLAEKMESIGSSLAEKAREHYDGAVDSLLEDLMNSLTEMIPTREDYSMQRSVTVNDSEGSPATLTYSYQDTFAHLISFIFSGTQFDTESLMEKLDELVPAFECLLEGVQTGNDQSYFDAGVKLKEFAADNGYDLPLTDAEAYALMTLLGPISIDIDYEPEGDVIDTDIMITYLMPLLGIGMNAGNISFSHHFDTIVSRLKLMADLPEIGNIDIAVESPRAGDAAAKAPEEVRNNQCLSPDYLTASSSWIDEGDTLEDNKVVYLQITLTAAAHKVPEGFTMTVNGAEPAEPLRIEEKAGASVITGIWSFSIGEPENVEISFDAGGHAADPESVSVPKGTRLPYAITAADYGIVKDGNDSWRFDGWTDKEGNAWADLYANEPMTLYANWTPVIDRVEITVIEPHIGETMKDPVFPEGCHYSLKYYDLSNMETYDTVDVVTKKVEHDLRLALVPEDGYEFLIEEDEYGLPEFKGIITVNGEEAEGLYNPEGNSLEFSYVFTPTDKPEDDGETQKITYRLDKGDDSYTKGSQTGLQFVFKRSEADETTYEHFTGLAVDGASLSESQYTKKPGSVIIDLEPAYLDTLEEGSHKLTASFDDGDGVDVLFTVTEEDKAQDDADKDDSTPKDENADGSKQDSKTDSTPDSSKKDENKNSSKQNSSKDEGSGSKSSKKNSSPVKTGDEQKPLLWLILLIGSAAAAAMIRKKSCL